MKRCPKCGEHKPLAAFGLRKKSPTGRKSWCRSCESDRQRELNRQRIASGFCRECGRAPKVDAGVFCTGCRDRHAAKRAARRQSGQCAACGAHAIEGRSRCRSCTAKGRIAQLALRAGMSEKQYADMLADQEDRCAICREQCRTGRRLAVDHDHSSGRIRGLLCFRCNISLARYEQYSQRFTQYLANGKIKAGLTL